MYPCSSNKIMLVIDSFDIIVGGCCIDEYVGLCINRGTIVPKVDLGKNLNPN